MMMNKWATKYASPHLHWPRFLAALTVPVTLILWAFTLMILDGLPRRALRAASAKGVSTLPWPYYFLIGNLCPVVLVYVFSLCVCRSWKTRVLMVAVSLAVIILWQLCFGATLDRSWRGKF